MWWLCAAFCENNAANTRPPHPACNIRADVCSIKQCKKCKENACLGHSWKEQGSTREQNIWSGHNRHILGIIATAPALSRLGHFLWLGGQPRARQAQLVQRVLQSTVGRQHMGKHQMVSSGATPSPGSSLTAWAAAGSWQQAKAAGKPLCDTYGLPRASSAGTSAHPTSSSAPRCCMTGRGPAAARWVGRVGRELACTAGGVMPWLRRHPLRHHPCWPAAHRRSRRRNWPMMASTRSRALCTAASSRFVACTMATRPSSPVKSRMPPRSAWCRQAGQGRAGQGRQGRAGQGSQGREGG